MTTKGKKKSSRKELSSEQSFDEYSNDFSDRELLEDDDFQQDLSDDGISQEEYLESGSEIHSEESFQSGSEGDETDLLRKREPKYDVFVEERHPTEKYRGKRREIPDEPKSKRSRPAMSMNLEFEDRIQNSNKKSKDQTIFDEVKLLEIENAKIISDLAKSQHSDAQRGVELKSQLKIGKTISNLLLDLHDPLKKLNAFPLENDIPQIFSGQADKLKSMHGKLLYLFSKLLYLNCKFSNTSSFKIPSAFESEQLWEQAETINSACLTESLEELDVWSNKLNHVSFGESKLKFKQLKVINQSLSAQLEMQMRDEARLIKKTQINREKISFLHNREIPIESAAIYDDTDFYLTLLKERDNVKLGNLNDPDKIAVRVNALKNAKVKKDIDTRASKGRKIKFVVIEKLANFMAPCDLNSSQRWSDEKRDKLFCSLFGKIPSNV